MTCTPRWPWRYRRAASPLVRARGGSTGSFVPLRFPCSKGNHFPVFSWAFPKVVVLVFSFFSCPRVGGDPQRSPEAVLPWGAASRSPIRWFPSVKIAKCKPNLQPCFVNSTLTRSQPAVMPRSGSGTQLLSGQTQKLPAGLPSPMATACSSQMLLGFPFFKDEAELFDVTFT